MSGKNIPINAGYPNFDWDKHAAVLAERRKGRTLADIGRDIGIKPEYVRQMINRMERREKALNGANENPVKLLPVRAHNAIIGNVHLTMWGGDTPISAEMLRAWLDSGTLSRMPGMGSESIHDVEHLLKSLGK